MSYWQGRKVLVTGGAGFIGSHLVEYLVEDEAKVSVADNLERGSAKNLEKVKDDLEFIQTDLKDIENCKRICQGQEIVLNLAAKVTGIHYNRSHHADMFESNMLLQELPLRAAAETGVKRFMQVSTACIYPHDAKVPTPEEEGERGEPEPTNAGYGWAKRMGEKLAKWYAEETDMEIVIARPFNAYGPRDYFDVKTSHVIPALIKKVMDGDNPVEVWGSGNQSRVFVHGKDFAKCLKLIAEKATNPEPINVGHDKEITIKELVYKIQDMTGIKNEVFFNTEMPEGYPRRAADTTRLREITGFIPSISLEEGLTEMIGDYEETIKDKKN